jgi:hypothetical protein
VWWLKYQPLAKKFIDHLIHASLEVMK